MKRISFVFSGVLLLSFFCGCMTSRSRCEMFYENHVDVISSAAEVDTARKYKIREVRMDACASAAGNSVMRKAAGSFPAVERIMYTCPGVFENDGEEVFVDIVSLTKRSGFRWTAVPCILTVGICPYFQRDEINLTADVSFVSDPSRKARFSCRIVDDWKISFLFQLGSIPYSDEVLKSSRIGKRGSGDVTIDVWREGIAVGVAKALREIEKKR